jgi:hypothetical protein
VHPAIAQLFVVQVGLLRSFIREFLDTGQLFPLALILFNPLFFSASETADYGAENYPVLSPKNPSTKFRMLGPPSYTFCEPSFVFVWLSNTGSCTRTEIAATILVRISEAS